VVVFATRRDLVLMAGDAAAKAGRRVGYIIGGQSAAERTAAVNAFQARELDVLCATTQAGGVGLTLTAARTAVFLQRPWSLVDALQAEDRIHRIGAEQHDSVEIVDIVASNTLDTRVRSVLREKGKQLADLVQDPRIVADLLGGAAVARSAA
jgi:SNF2 family DNA or RNA helicase